MHGPSFRVLRAIPYSVAAVNCKVEEPGACRFLGMRAAQKQDDIPFTPNRPNDDDDSPEANLWRKITGSACVCMKSNDILREQAEHFKNKNDLCSGEPDYRRF